MSGEAAAIAAATATAPATPATDAKPSTGTDASTAAGAAEQQKPPPKATDWAELSARDRRLQADRERVKRDREQVDRDRAALAEERRGKPDALTKETIAARLKAGESPLAVLSDLGLSYKDLTTSILSQGKKDPAAETKKLVDAALAEERAKNEQATRETQERQAEAAWQQVFTDVDTLVKSGGEAFEMVGLELEANREVVHRALREMEEFDRAQRTLPPEKRMQGYRPLTGIEDAAGRYEAYLLSLHQKRSAASKLKPKDLSAVDSAAADQSGATGKSSPAAADTSGQTASAGGPRTLTQAHAQTRAVQPPGQAANPAPKRVDDPVERIRLSQEEEQRRLASATEVLRQLNKK